MAEYIERQAALDALKQQADTMRTWVERYAEQRIGILTAVNIVEDIESADVVQVVRCKDCRYFRKFLRECERSGALTMYPLRDTDFCSYGERREE